MTTEGRLKGVPGDATAGEEVVDAPDDDVAGDDAGSPSGDDLAGEPAGDRPRWRQVAAWVTTALAGLFVLFALIVPNDINLLTLGAFLRIPVEGLLGVALVLVLPTRTMRVLAVLGGVVLGLLTILKLFDMGFLAVMYRPFDPVLDWTFLESGVDYLTVTVGRAGAIGAVVGVVVLFIAVPILMALSALRLTRILSQHRTAATRSVVVGGVVWVILAVFSVQIVPGLTVASRSAAGYAYIHARQLPEAIQDQREFAAEVGVDAFRDTPGDQLLTALRGKDVVFTFVESLGRSAVEHPELAPQIGAVLDDGTRRLRAAGFNSRSAFLTSPTVGGGSWLAHCTLLSGLWIDNQQRYHNLVASDRLTLNRAFQRAGWRTVGVEPAITQAYPEGAFFGYDRIYAFGDLGYRGPRFSYATMPDQYILSAFQREERAKPGHAPLMAQIITLSSHSPFGPIPQLIDWNDIGDGSVFSTMAATDAPPESIFSRDVARVRADYTRSIEYSLNSLFSWVETYGDDNLVLVFLGDHQPAPFVTGENAGPDAPITIVARDPAVLDRISGWGWHDGLKPGPQAPVWRMDTFRDRFLTAFGPS